MRSSSWLKSFMGLCALALFLPSAQASLTTFDLSWSGASFGNSAVATGTITMDPTVLGPGENDNSGYFFPANPFATALTITISGASSGNGTFTLGDFDTVLFDNGGGSLNFTQELVGQPTSGNSWGTPDGISGDFNLFNRSGIGGSAPDGTFYFTLTTNAGAGDEMLLTSFRPAVASVPEPSGITVIATSLGLTGATILRRRRTR